MIDTYAKERELLKTVYKSRKWSLKVDRMAGLQVIAIILRLKKQGKLS